MTGRMRYIQICNSENAMTMPLRKEEFEGLFEAPPASDWTQAFAALTTLQDLRRVADRFDVETSAWITKIHSNLEEGSDRVLRAALDHPRSEVSAFMVPLLGHVVASAESAIKTHDTPFHEHKDAKQAFDRLKKVSGPTGRFVRKQINRIEDIRVKRRNAMVDMYYALLAFQAEIEDTNEVSPEFSDATALSTFLRKHVA